MHLSTVTSWGFYSLLAVLTQSYLWALDRRHRSWRHVFALTLALVSLLVAQSRTAWVVTILAVILAATLSLAGRRAWRPSTLASVFLGAISVLAAAVFTFSASGLRLLGRDATLTGRTDIWQAAADAINERVLQGYGWGALWSEGTLVTEQMWSQVGFRFQHAHNGYLELALQGGLVAVLLSVWLTASVFIHHLRAQALESNPESQWVLVLVTVLLIYNLSEPVAYQGIGLILLVMLATNRAQGHRVTDLGRASDSGGVWEVGIVARNRGQSQRVLDHRKEKTWRFRMPLLP